MAKPHYSWEIIVAGFLLTALAIYIMSNDSSSGNENNSPAPDMISSGDNTSRAEETQGEESPVTINLHQLEEHLREPGNWEKFKGLEKLKELKQLKQWPEQEKSGQITIKAEGETKESIRQSIEEAARELEKMQINLPINPSEMEIRKTGERTYSIKPSGAAETKSSVEGNYAHKKQIDAQGVNKMDISLASGHLTINGNSGNQIVVKIRSTDNDQASDEIRDQVDIFLTRDNGQAKLDMDLADKGWFNFLNTNEYDISIELPRNIDTKGSTGGGHINVSNLDGTHNLSTSGGHIELNNATGKYTLSTSGGHIKVNETKAQLELSTSGGHINLNQVEGNMAVETSGGNIKGTALKGSLNGETSGGNIKTDFQEVRGDINLETSAGNINLNFPQTTSADVELQGVQVDLGSGFKFSGVKETGEASGTINGGGAIKISCRTSIGNVTLSGNSDIQ